MWLRRLSSDASIPSKAMSLSWKGDLPHRRRSVEGYTQLDRAAQGQAGRRQSVGTCQMSDGGGVTSSMPMTLSRRQTRGSDEVSLLCCRVNLCVARSADFRARPRTDEGVASWTPTRAGFALVAVVEQPSPQRRVGHDYGCASSC